MPPATGCQAGPFGPRAAPARAPESHSRECVVRKGDENPSGPARIQVSRRLLAGNIDRSGVFCVAWFVYVYETVYAALT
jgi:hypothetical protein